MLIPASAISKGPAAPSSMKMLAHNSLPRFAAWITSCSSPNPTSNLFWKSFSRMSTPKALTTLWTPCPSVLSPNGCASVWPSWATPRITPRENSWTLFARRRMPEPRFLVVRLGSLGDIVHTFPAVAALRESFPSAEIVWLTHPRWKELVESSELATDIWEIETRSYKSLREIIGRIRKRYVVLGPSGGWRSKCWPPDRYGALCGKIRDTLGIRCVLNHGPGEEDLVSAIKVASGEADPIAYNGSLGQLMALLRNAACVVGGDTGPLHLAVALGTPAVGIFGPTDPARNCPHRIPHHPLNASPLNIVVLRSPHALPTSKRSAQPAPSIL